MTLSKSYPNQTHNHLSGCAFGVIRPKPHSCTCTVISLYGFAFAWCLEFRLYFSQRILWFIVVGHCLEGPFEFRANLTPPPPPTTNAMGVWYVGDMTVFPSGYHGRRLFTLDKDWNNFYWGGGMNFFKKSFMIRNFPSDITKALENVHRRWPHKMTDRYYAMRLRLYFCKTDMQIRYPHSSAHCSMLVCHLWSVCQVEVHLSTCN